jgi:hypothetical protein
MIVNGFPAGDVELIKLKKSDIGNHSLNFSWKDEGEFRFNNRMYDVIREEIVGDTIYFYCLHDDKETGLYVILDSLFCSGLDDSGNDSNDWSGFENYLSHYYSGSNCNLKNYTLEKNFANNYNGQILEGVIQINTPPPNHSC